MFVVMTVGASEAEILGVKSRILAEGLTPFDHVGEERTVIAVVGEIGSRRPALLEQFARLPGVASVTPISRPYKLVSREFHPEDTVIRVLDAVIGDGSLTVMAGPCSVESKEQLFETADAVKAAGATILRGGAFKPRTSPYSFQGLGVQGLRYLAEARERTGLPVITEVMEPNQVDIVAEYADILQIGTRNMQNYSLLRDVGRVARPVMLKRGYGATVEEWLMAAEYIVSSGNPNVILCERGIRTFETFTRNTMDLAAVPVINHLTHLPVIIDPSHATGKRWLVKPLAVGGVAVGADGIMVEVHPHPDDALSDAEQQLDFEGFREMMAAVLPVHAAGARPVRAGRVNASPAADQPVARVAASARLRGELLLPGDKSISHRALLLAALAAGESVIEGAGDGADVRSTAGIVAALGAEVDRRSGDGPTVTYRIVSPGADGLREPAAALDCGNSGTSLRLMRRHARRAADDDDPRRGRFIARPTGRSYHRTTALDGRGASRSAERLPPSRDRGRSYPSPGDRVHDADAKRAGEVRDPAGGVASGWPNHGPRIGRHARPHGTDVEVAGRAGREQGIGERRNDRDGRRRSDGARDDGTGPGRRLGGGVLARRGRHPPRRRARPARRGCQPDPPCRDRHPAVDGRRHRGAACRRG